MEELKRLIREVHRRSLWQVLAIYVGAAWIVFEVVQTLTEGLGLPGWFPSLALVLLLVGLPIVLATAFVQEGLTEGPRHDPTLIPRSDTPHLGEPSAPRRFERLRIRDLLTWRNALLGGMAAFALWGVVAAGWLFLEGRAAEGIATPAVSRAGADDTTAARDPENVYRASVAVLPFDNLGNAEDEYFSEGITEEIIAQLAQVEGLKVISRTSVLALRGAALTTPEIADTLGVRHVLEGSVRRWQDQVRITAQLIDAETDAHLWAESFTRKLEHLFDLQDEIAAKVSEALVTTVRTLRPTGKRTRTEVATAHDAYLAGQHWMHERTPQGLRRAIEAFEEAIALDSTYAPAYAGLARALLLWVGWGYGGGPDAYPAMARALAAADQAIALDPRLAEGYLARGNIMNAASAPPELAAPDFERALELQPNSADLRGWYAELLVREGRFEHALAEARKAVDLDPLAPGRRMGYSFVALVARRYDIALREARRALTLGPQLEAPHVWEGLSLMLQGRARECAALDLGPHAAIRAACLYSAGERARASAIADSVGAAVRAGDLTADPDASEPRLVRDLVFYYAWLTDTERTLEWLEHGVDLSPHLSLIEPQLEIFDGIRGESDFAERFDRLREGAWDRLRRMSQEIDVL